MEHGQLAMNLEAIVSQRLAKTHDGKDRIPVVEIMRSTPVIRKLLREDQVASISKAIASQEQGMQLFDQHLAKLWQHEIISGTEALRLATNPEAMNMIMRGLSTRNCRSMASRLVSRVSSQESSSVGVMVSASM